MTPPSERKAKERQAKRDAGLVRVEVWVRQDHAQAVKSYAQGLTQPIHFAVGQTVALDVDRAVRGILKGRAL